jgi:hypothetical protein
MCAAIRESTMPAMPAVPPRRSNRDAVLASVLILVLLVVERSV